MLDIYKEKGYKDRNDYLHSLADEYNIPFEYVCLTAEIYGQDEDFDGLVCACEDYAGLYDQYDDDFDPYYE